MQPYFMPYIGYWQLMNVSDIFVVYDDIQYTKKGWINRNRFLLNGKDELFSIPLKKDSDYLNVSDRYLSDGFDLEKEKLIRRFESAYRKAPFYLEGIDLVKACLKSNEKNLFDFIYQSIVRIRAVLGINSRLVASSAIKVDGALKGQDRVIAICKALDASDYVNPPGGEGLYSREEFRKAGINLFFQRIKPYAYKQFNYNFIPHLSIIDVVMFNGFDKTKIMLGEMDLF